VKGREIQGQITGIGVPEVIIGFYALINTRL
jgi:hypothetical protein